MITILLGSDALSKQKYLIQEISDKNLEVIKIRSADEITSLSSLSEAMLFGPKPAYVIEKIWKDLDAEELLSVHADSDATIYIVEDTIDQRKTVNKNALRDKRITVKEFESPLGGGAGRWISGYAKSLDVKISDAAIERLSTLLAPEEKGKLDVLLAHNELLKLKSYANGLEITPEMVEDITSPVLSINIFELLDAIGEKNKVRAIILLEKYFAASEGDEKSHAIRFSALLADQLRNILTVIDSSQRAIPDNIVLEKTGWKDKRLFVMKKLSKNFSSKQIKLTLSKIESLDMELKSTTTPPQLIMDMIISQM